MITAQLCHTLSPVYADEHLMKCADIHLRAMYMAHAHLYVRRLGLSPQRVLFVWCFWFISLERFQISFIFFCFVLFLFIRKYALKWEFSANAQL